MNARLIFPHFALIKDLISFRDLDILALSETWLRASDVSSELSIQGYCLMRADRHSDARGGEVALYINSSISFSTIDLDSLLSGIIINIVGATVFLRGKRLAVFAIYRPPT